MKAVGQLQSFWQNLPLLEGKFFLRDLLSNYRPLSYRLDFSAKLPPSTAKLSQTIVKRCLSSPI
jgi:hypothetical protein